MPAGSFHSASHQPGALAIDLPVTANTSHTAPENRAFYPALDGLRAVAFLLVFSGHYTHLPFGWAGVDLFFVLSGFLITGILYDTRNDTHRARNFYVRRTLRIFPLYYSVFSVLFLTSAFAHWQWGWRWIIWPLYLGNLASLRPVAPASPGLWLATFSLYGSIHGHALLLHLGHFWSLCLEEQFYVLWPWLVFSLRDRRKLQWLCALALPVCLLARLLGQHLMPPWLLESGVLYTLLPFRLDDLLAGGLLALLIRGPHRNTVLRATSLALPFCLVILLLYVTAMRGSSSDPRFGLNATFALSFFGLLGVTLISSAIQTGTWVHSLLRWQPLRWIGRISYGAYILHDIPHDQYFYFGSRLHLGSRFQIPLLALGCTLLGAWLSFRLIETPFLNFKERWTVRATTPSTS